jgi:methyl-accepting chemotaxis protein
MKIKTKLLLGFGLLFVVVVFFGVVSVYYIENISENSKKTVKNNYETLTFTREMRSVLDESDLPLTAKEVQAFDNSLKKQENNITEPGEKEATQGVRAAFSALTIPGATPTGRQKAEKDIRSGLKTIDGLNMKAIVTKNEEIHKTVSDATLFLGGIVFVTFLILFVFIVNFPGFILKPLNEFIGGVHDIAEKNYDTRLEFKTQDEFADLAMEFNRMAANLSEMDYDASARMLMLENQLRILAEEVDGAVIALNNKHEILHVNGAARELLKIGDKIVSGHSIREVTNGSALVKSILESHNGDTVSDHHVKQFEIVVPNLRPKPLDTLQFSGHTAGMVYILTAAGHGHRKAVKTA